MAGRLAPAPKGAAFNYVRPWLYPKQQLALFDCPDLNGETARYGLCEASTKAGKTSACIAWLFEQAIGCASGQSVWWVAPVYGQAKIAFRRMKEGLADVKWLWTANNTELTITLKTGVMIWFKSGEKPDNLYGEDVYACVVDEASRVREDSWHAVRSVLTATKGPIRIIGNVKGRSNWFYRLCRLAESGRPGMSYAKLNAWDAVAGGVLDKAEIEDAQAVLPDHVFAELYLAEASDDDGNPFGWRHIQACVGGISGERPVAIGVDLAKARDWTVVIGLDRFGHVCGMERWQLRPWPETMRRILELIGNVPTLVDSTGVGSPVVDELQQKRPGTVAGYVFTSASKQRLMEGLAVGIQGRILRYPPGQIKSELETFEYKYGRTGVSYTAPEGLHDDCVMALGLAYEHLRAVNPAALSTAPASFLRVSPYVGAASSHEDPP